MSNWKDILVHITSDIEDHYDALKLRLRKALGLGPVHVLPYIGHGTRRHLYLKGRVLSDYSVVPPEDNDTTWDNLLNMYRRFNSHEIPHACLKARFQGREIDVTANGEGFFEVHIETEQPLSDDRIWYDIALEAPDYAGQDGAQATGRVIVPPSTAQFGVISDIDDTVIQSDVLHLIRLARNTFLHNARTRLPFPGVAGFYRALQQGTPPTFNPIYYVSNSPWNLYDLLVGFFEVRHIPPGPVFLRDLGLTEDHFVAPDPIEHKLGRIQHLLDSHPALPFILIGDSTEHDPEIYAEAVRRNPNRVTTIYIRDVAEKHDDAALQTLIGQVLEAGSELLLVPDTEAAARHAIRRGYVSADNLPDILEERQTDKREPDTVEKLVDAVT
jgi:phosphatidate phosphatase APP1